MSAYDCYNCFRCDKCYCKDGPLGFGDDFDNTVTVPYMKLVDGRFVNADTQEIDVSEVEFI